MSPTKTSRGSSKQIDKNVLLVAQEITFAKILSGNDSKIRERGIKRLQKWLTARSSSSHQFKENDLKRIWKGLFYCMWMSDKPLVQEEVAENISNLVHCFENTKACICFVKCFFLTMAVEWRGLDQWRMDKFLMFVRRFLRQVFVYSDKRSWPLKLIKELGAVFNSSILPDHKALSENPHPPIGFSLHFVDIYMDELTKVSKGHLHNNELLVALLRPFAVYMSEAPEQVVATHIVPQIFDRLIEQSEEGHKFREKFEAWKQLGFPRGHIDAVQRVHREDSDEEMDEDEADDEGALDPRAGGVNVELPVAQFNPEAVVNLLREYRHSKTSTSWSRKIVARVMARFSAMERGKYPLGIKKVDKVPKINFKKLAKKSAEELFEFRERIMYEDDDDWIESIRGGKNKGKAKSAPGKSTKCDEDDDSEGLDDDDEELDDDDEELDDDDEGSNEDVDVDSDDDLGSGDDLGSVDDLDSDDDLDSYDDDDVDDDDDDVEIGDDGAEVDSEEDAEVDDGEDVGEVGDEVTSEEKTGDIEDTRNGDLEEEGEEEKEYDSDGDNKESEVNVELEEASVVNSGKRNKKKKNKQFVERVTPQKQMPKNLPQVIPFGISNKKQKNKQAVEETPQKKTRGNFPQVISNGSSKKQKRQPGNENANEEETVIIVGRKRKLAEALATPVIQRGKQFKNFQHSPRTPQTPGSAKRVQFILQRNTAQATSEYDKILRENPGNPFDSAKKPRFSVLKSTPLASPVNPFYNP